MRYQLYAESRQVMQQLANSFSARLETFDQRRLFNYRQAFRAKVWLSRKFLSQQAFALDTLSVFHFRCLFYSHFSSIIFSRQRLHFQPFVHCSIVLGMDRLVRIWNPYLTSKPTGLLKGHTAPICHLFIASEEKRLFSISTDRCIRVIVLPHDVHILSFYKRQ